MLQTLTVRKRVQSFWATRFEALSERDPHRLQNMDTYSNILYVKECKAELSYLAQVTPHILLDERTRLVDTTLIGSTVAVRRASLTYRVCETGIVSCGAEASCQGRI